MTDFVDRRVLLGAAGLAGAAAIARLAQAGSLAPPAGAVAPTPGPEPRIPINSTNTPGDASAVYRITQSGSYYLTGNITVADTTRSAIRVTSADVSIDLMGYTITGVTNGVPGILGDGVATNLRISSGIVRTCGVGIHGQGDQTHVSGVAVTSNGTGILIGTGILVECTAKGNTGTGLQANAMARIESCVVMGVASSTGIVSTNGAVTNCAVNGGATGYFLTGSTVIGCNADSCAEGYFIQTSMVRDCRAGFSSTNGFRVGSVGSHVEGCFATACQTGFNIPASGNFIVRNCARGCVTPYSIGVGTQGGIGQINNATAVVIVTDNSYANWIT